MKTTICIIFSFIVLSFIANAIAEDYFPKGTFNDFRTSWYSNQYTALDEHSLFMEKNKSTNQIYRFTWLRTFHHPISIRLEIKNDEIGTLFIKMANGAGGYDPGELVTNESRQLSKSEITGFSNLINKASFWKIPTETPPDPNGKLSICIDGAQWILEGLSKGNYHIVDRCSPKDGATRELCFYLLKLSGLKIKNEEIY